MRRGKSVKNFAKKQKKMRILKKTENCADLKKNTTQLGKPRNGKILQDQGCFQGGGRF